jgi:hypothetical protein
VFEFFYFVISIVLGLNCIIWRFGLCGIVLCEFNY